MEGPSQKGWRMRRMVRKWPKGQVQRLHRQWAGSVPRGHATLMSHGQDSDSQRTPGAWKILRSLCGSYPLRGWACSYVM